VQVMRAQVRDRRRFEAIEDEITPPFMQPDLGSGTRAGRRRISPACPLAVIRRRNSATSSMGMTLCCRTGGPQCHP
jgi:hypothetical protein